jgi:hypothetical protein
MGGPGARSGHGTRAAVLASAGCLALTVGLLVYLTDRDPAHSTLIPAIGALAGGHLFGVLGLWLPGFIHPLAFSLVTASVLPAGSRWSYGACAIWCAVNIAFELGQHPDVSARLAGALQDTFGDTPLTRAIGSYFIRGTWDPGDVVASLLGALAAAAVLRLVQTSWERDHAQQ